MPVASSSSLSGGCGGCDAGTTPPSSCASSGCPSSFLSLGDRCSGLLWRLMGCRLDESTTRGSLAVLRDLMNGPYGSECTFIVHASAILVTATTLRTMQKMIAFYYHGQGSTSGTTRTDLRVPSKADLSEESPSSDPDVPASASLDQTLLHGVDAEAASGATAARPSTSTTRAARHRLLRYWRLVESAVLRDEESHTKVGSLTLHVAVPPKLLSQPPPVVTTPTTTTTTATATTEKEPFMTLEDVEAQQQLLLATREQVLVLAPTDTRYGCFASPLPSRSPWRALGHIWHDTIRYEANPDEVLEVLLAHDTAERAARGDGADVAEPSQPVRVAAANLAVTWYVTVLRIVYEAVAQRHDTEGCEDELSLLRRHRDRLYQRCVAPLATSDGCDLRTCWAVLRAGETALRRQRRRLMWSNTWYLFRYMYASSQGKMASAAMLFIMTRGAGMLNATGTYLRDTVSSALTTLYEDRTASPRDDSDGDDAMNAASVAPIVALCSVELLRLVLNTIVLSSTQQFIRASASRRRDEAKKELYEALTHMPLAFYDLHTYDEIEEMVYYVNDLEGVDVHIHQYICQTAANYLAMSAALAPLPRGLRGLVVGTVLTSLAVKGVGAVVARWYHARLRDGTFARWFPWSHGRRRRRADGGEDDRLVGDSGGDDGGAEGEEEDGEDLQESENRSSVRQRDGIMLRGLEIIAAVPSLRPYGAEVGMMRWWNTYNGGRARMRTTSTTASTTATAKRIDGQRLVDWFYQYVPLSFLVRNGKLGVWLPVLGTSLLSLVDWLLPVVVATYGATTAAALECGSSSRRGGDGDDGDRRRGACGTRPSSFADHVSVWSTGSFRLLAAMEATRQCVESIVDGGRVVEVVLRNGYKASVLARLLDPRCWEDSRPPPPRATGVVETVARSLSGSMAFPGPPEVARCVSDRCMIITHIHTQGLQFRYPTAPTVDVYVAPLTIDIRLFDEETGKGRLVCLAGPSGCGKSTLLSLLLGLYDGAFKVHSGGDHDTVVAVSNDPIVVRLLPDGAASSAIEAPLRTLPPDVLRTNLFSFVPQYPTIFSGATIAHNISLQDFVSIEEVSVLQRAAVCAERAHCAEFIDRFPQGLLTRITDAAGASNVADCVRLSGGQAQRLMLARALYHSSGVLLMDEPTASLDAETKDAVLQEYRSLLDCGAVRGILCSTHDETVMRIADEVIRVPYRLSTHDDDTE